MATKKVTDLAEVTTLNNSDTFMVHDGNGLKKTTFSNLKGKVTEGKADKATTLAGYGITDAYTKGETQKNYGLNFSVGFNSSYIPITIDTTTDIQNGTFTSSDIVTAFISSDVEYIRSGAFTGCTNLKSVNIMNKAEGITIEQDAFGYDVQVNYINSYNYLKYAGIALRNLNTQKADNTNVYSRTVLDGKFAALPTYEEGSGTLTPTAENKLKNASFTYQRLGNCVTVQIACTFLAYEQTADGTVRLNGLPFVCGNDLPPRLLNITSQKREVISAISYSTSALVLIFRQAESFTEDETLSFEITYKIK